MKKTVTTSLIALGIGAAAYGLSQRNNNMPKTMMKNMRKMSRALF